MILAYPHKKRLLLAIGLSLSLIPRGGAFDSFPGGGIHRDITHKGLLGKAISDDAVKRIVSKNYDQDWNEVSVSLGGIKPNNNYHPEHHFDRNKLITHTNAFKAGARYVNEQRRIVVDSLAAGNVKTATEALGRALHARQDFFSHSNFIDLSETDQKIARQALNDSAKNPPTTVKITGYDRTTGKDISDDEYGHDKFCKDNPKKNAEAQKKISDQFTKFDWAKEFAVQDTMSFVDGIRSEVGESAWEKLTKF